MAKFATALIRWQRSHGRSGLPWQDTRDPYRVWLSEIMLQQTQVAAVIPYYQRFLHRFPDIPALAAADEEQVLRLWSGLGYYARARNLHRAARAIVEQHAGRFPQSIDAMVELPGIGRSTASAIAAFCFGTRAAILDGNVKRVLARAFGIEGWPGLRVVETRLWAQAESLLPRRDLERYTQALMDLGATLCTRGKPKCGQCPLSKQCVARLNGLTDLLPAARPRKALPVKSATWLLLRHAHDVLLEKRPGSGLWGGLWTFPELQGGDAVTYCKRTLGCQIGVPAPMEPLEHAFTHFRLRVRPLLCEVSEARPMAQSPGRMWLDLNDAIGAAVPAPVKKLLARLAAEQGIEPQQASLSVGEL
jgi:A/G-specific adenine glycosylase